MMIVRLFKGEGSQKGSVAILVALALTAMLGMTALAADVGLLYVEQQRVSAAVDTAVLAGVQYLPDSPSGAAAAVQQYLTLNGMDAATAQIEFADLNQTLRVRMVKTVPLHFGRILGMQQANLAGFAGAQRTGISGVQGAAPLGVPEAAWQIGQQVTLKLAATSEETAGPGNYLALALGKDGASTYEQNMMYGYPEWLRQDQWVSTEPGNMSGPAIRAVKYRIEQDKDVTWSGVTRGSPRLMIVPVLTDFNVNGKGEVQVTGFAVMFLEGAIAVGNDKGEIYGRFLEMVVEGESSLIAPDFGAYKFQLIN